MTSRCRKQLALFGLVPALSAPAQEAFQNMLAGDSAAQARNQQMQAPQVQDYTFKEGDFRMLVTPSMGLEWNDNVNLADTNVLSDEIIMPAVGLRATYPWSERNLLYLDVTVGYDWYLQHPRFSSFQFDSGSGTGLSFDMAIKDITLNLHDRLSYAQGRGRPGRRETRRRGPRRGASSAPRRMALWPTPPLMAPSRTPPGCPPPGT